MKAKISRTVLSGLIGTAIMTIFMMIAQKMGMPKMSPPIILSSMLEMPVWAGWIMHFIIGILLAFVFAQIVIGIMGSIVPIPKMEGSIMLTMMGSLFGHIVFGMVVSKLV